VPFWRASRSSAQSEATAAMLASGVSQRPVAQQLGGSAPAVSTPHRGARFAFDAMVGIGRRKPGSIRPPGNQETTDPQPASCFWGSLGRRRGRQLEQVLPTRPRSFISNKAVRSAPAAGQHARADATHDLALRADAAIAGGRAAATVAASGHLAPEMKRLPPSLVRGFPASCRSGSGYI
jgi:hypothetical protein